MFDLLLRCMGAALTLFLTFVGMTIAALPAAAADACTTQSFEDVRFVVCSFDPATSDIRLYWQDSDDKPLRTFSALRDTVEAKGKVLRFGLNAGMYDSDFRPLGLFVADGERLVPANTAEARAGERPVPNFFKKPNGVFFIEGNRARILPTDDYLAEAPEANIATQSGPMLVTDGALHPALIPNSTDKTRRSGVGICDGGIVRFVLSEDRVNFHAFARFFRDELGCPDALFLDGGRGVGLYQPELGRNDFSWHGGFGPMFAVVE